MKRLGLSERNPSKRRNHKPRHIFTFTRSGNADIMQEIEDYLLDKGIVVNKDLYDPDSITHQGRVPET